MNEDSVEAAKCCIFKMKLILSSLLLIGISLPALAENQGVAEDFGLLDHNGQFHQLSYYHKDPQNKGIVIFTHGIGCPLVRKRYEDLNRLHKEYASKGIRFWMLNASDQDERSDLAEEALEYKVSLPILDDTTQEVARSLNIDRTGEALLIDTSNWNILFRGAIDDRLSYEKEKAKASDTPLKNAIDDFLANRSIKVSHTEAPGCLIHYPTWQSHKDKKISYSQQIAPIIQEKCADCHLKGGIGPFAFSSYRKVRGWSDMMREVLMTRRMPPWQADPHHGNFSQDLSLTPEEKQILLHWIEQGTPRGEGEDPLAINKRELKPWPLGKPDHVIDLPAQKVPANGIVDYRYTFVSSPFEQDTWITGADIHPGDRQALHHVIIYIVPEDGKRRRSRRWLTGYAPGVKGSLFPESTGVLLKKEERLLFELHYTAYGKEVMDETQLGLYLSDESAKHSFRTGLFYDDSIQIPPHDRSFEWSQTREIREDIILYSMNPHMHFRGKSMAFELETPQGTRETLVSVPQYNFNWQHTYVLQKPRRIAKGSKLTLHAVWDNSDRNQANPDPSRRVPWGQQSFDEMFFGTYQYVRDKGQALPEELLSSVR
jgi:hypothetical protein